MNRINLLILIVFVLLTGCSRQETIRAAGEGEYWKAHVVYEVSNSELSDRGGLNIQEMKNLSMSLLR